MDTNKVGLNTEHNDELRQDKNEQWLVKLF